MVQLKTNQTFKFGQTNILPILGETKISQSGIIEVPDQETADILKASQIGFYDLNDPIFTEGKLTPESANPPQPIDDLEPKSVQIQKLKDENLKLKTENSQLVTDNKAAYGTITALELELKSLPEAGKNSGIQAADVLAMSSESDTKMIEELTIALGTSEEKVKKLEEEKEDLAKKLATAENNLKLAKLKAEKAGK